MIINNKSISLKRYLAITPNDYGWRVFNGHLSKIGHDVRIGGCVWIGNGVRIGHDVRIGDCVSIGDGVQIGNNVRIGGDVRIGHRVWIGDDVSIGDYVRVKWMPSLKVRFHINPYAPGHVVCDCYIGDYDTILSWTDAVWRESDYTDDERDATRSFIAWCRDNEHLFWMPDDDGQEI